MYAINSSEFTQWEPIKSKTLAQAKALCTKRYGKGYKDSSLFVGKKMGDFYERVAIKERQGRLGSTWRELEI